MFLITGANGQLGLSFKKFLRADQAYFCSHQELDITQAIDPKKFINLKAIINCAAYTNVEKAEDEFDLACLINGHALIHLTKLANTLDIPLIHFSTDYVFDGKSKVPYKPLDKTSPLSAYGKSKRLGEEIFLREVKRGAVIRTSWVYSEYGNNFVKTMLRLGAERSELKVVSDQWGSPTYATDLVEATLTILKSKLETVEMLHFTNLGIITWFDFATEIMRQKSLSCKVIPIPTTDYPTKAARPLYSALEASSWDIRLRPWQESLDDCLKLL